MSISSLPTRLQQHILNYCTLKDIICVDLTCKEGYLVIKNIWMNMLADRNLFIYVTRVLSTHSVRFYSLYRNDTYLEAFTLSPDRPHIPIPPTEFFLPNPFSYLRDPHSPWAVKNKIYLLNLKILSRFSLPSGLTPLTCSSSNLNSLQIKFINQRASKVPLKSICFQIMKLDKNLACQPGTRNSISTTTEFALDAFDMLERSLTSSFTLFNFLDSYRFVYAPTLLHYTHASTLLILKAINLNDPERLRILLENLKLRVKKNYVLLMKTNKISYEEATKLSPPPLNLTFSKTHCPEFTSLVPQYADGRTPLNYAITCSHCNFISKFPATTCKIVQMLIAAKANVNEPGLLLKAVSLHKDKDPALVDLLIKGRANVHQIEKGQPLLMQLLEMERKIAKNNHESLSLLLKAGAHLNCYNTENNMTPLMRSASSDHSHHTFKLILKQSMINLTDVDHSGKTVLMHCIIHDTGLLKMIPWLRCLELNGCISEIDRQDNDGRTALHHLILNWNDRYSFRTLTNFLKEGPNLILKDNFGFTPYDIAIARGLNEPIYVLLIPNSNPHKRKRREDESKL